MTGPHLRRNRGPHLRRDRAHIRAATAAHICARIRATRHAAARKFPKLRAHNYELAGVPGLFVAGEIEPVKKMVMGETGSQYRVQARSKIRDLMVFALSEDLHALRVAAGTNVEVQLRK